MTELPVHLTRFIGREHELEELGRLLHATRLLTLTGAGGSGKTRLAREAAAQAREAFGRVVWVDLTPIADGDLVAQQVASALSLPDRAGLTPLDLVLEALREQRALLVLDNCEHVVVSSAMFVDALLRGCGHVTVLATSREALGVASETAWLVPPLAANEAAQLFTERARLAMPSFTPRDADAAAVDEICRRLDGIPLAIEFAAARVRVLTPTQIASRLDDAFRLLSAGARTALPRHRTLRATMEWSFSLLGAREQVLLRRLSVFAGSFTLDAVEAVCVGEPLAVDDILDGVSALVDKSLIVMSSRGGLARYRLLETVRQYGAERLEQAGEVDAVALRFSRHFVERVEAVAPLIVGGAVQRGLIERLSVEHDNIRAAVLCECVGDEHTELGLRFLGGLAWYWYAVGQFREARQLCDHVLARDASNVAPAIRGRAHLASALTAFFQGDSARAFRDFDAALALLRDSGDALSFGTALAKYGAARLMAADLDGAITLLDEAMEFTRDAPANDITQIFAVFWRGWAAYANGDVDTAHHLVARVAAAGRQFQLPTTLGHGLSVIGQIQLTLGNVEAACAAVGESLEIEVESGDGWGIANALDVVTAIAAHRGRTDDATRLMGAVDAHRDRLAVALPGLAPRDREALVARVRSSVGAQFDACYDDGHQWTTEHAVRVAFAEVERHTAEHRAAPAVVVAQEPRTGQPPLRVLALGPLQVFVGDRAIDPTTWGSARPRELLVYLLTHPDGRTKEQVGLAFWPEASTAQLRNNFHVTLHRLRKALGIEDCVVFANERYRIDGAMIQQFDVSDFETSMAEATRALRRGETSADTRLESALALFRGDFLDGEPVGDWHLEHRDRLQRVYIDGLMMLAGRHTAEERFAKAAEAYRRVLARDELHEDAAVALMRAHAALGERAQALRVYQRFAARLQEELGADPDDGTTRLFEQLQQGIAPPAERYFTKR